jgi:hypothetical protein
MTSWILTNVAALYWRVEGDAKKAMDCLRLSLTTAPKNKKVIIQYNMTLRRLCLHYFHLFNISKENFNI